MRRLTIAALAGLLALSSTWSTPAHANETDVEALQWFMVNATMPIAGKWKFYMEAQPRMGTDPATRDFNLRALLIRPAAGYQITDEWSLWAGYGYTPTFDPYRYENRVFQQSLHVTNVGPVKMVNRTRLEERMIQDAGQPAMRLRHYLWFQYPLPQAPKWSLIAAAEPFINLNTVTNGPIAGFDQNRLYLGVGRQLTDHLRVEVDYLNQFVDGHDGADDTVRNGGFLLLAFNF
jgi:hypothetical protein